MLLSHNDLERIAYTARGELTAIPFPVLLVAYAALRRTLLLQVSRGPVNKVITVVDGMPVDCQSNLLQDNLARYLVSRGQLSEAAADAMQAEAAATDQSVEQIIGKKGGVERETLAKSQQQHLARKLLDAFAWDSGTFEIAPLSAPPETTLRLKIPQLLLMGVDKLAPTATISAAIAQWSGRPIFLSSQPTFPLAELRLNPRQQTLVEQLRSGKRIEELLTEGGDGRAERLLYSLALLGMLSFEPAVEAPSVPPPAAAAVPAVPRAGSATVPPPIATLRPPRAMPQPAPHPATAAPPTTAATPAPASASVVDASESLSSAARRREVLELYERFSALDAFDLLNVKVDAPSPDIERGLLLFCERTAPWAVAGDDIETKARELFLAGIRAFSDLMDPERRTAIQSRRVSPLNKAQDSMKAAREAFKIQTGLLDPRRQFEKGCAFMERKRYPEALEQLQYAVDCDPQNATYRAELARCHWLSQPAARARSSVRDLEQATQLDPECGIAFLHLGEILVSLEKIEEAREALKRAAHLLLPDRRGLEMLNALPAPGRKGKTAGKLGKWF